MAEENGCSKVVASEKATHVVLQHRRADQPRS